MYNMFNMYSLSMSRWSENSVHNKLTGPIEIMKSQNGIVCCPK